MKRLGVFLGTLAVLAIAGCGGGASETPQQEVESVAKGFSAAFGSGEIKAACRFWGPAETQDRAGTCYRIYNDGIGASWKQSFLTAKVERAAVTGSRATVAYSNESIAKLKKADEGWVIYELGEAKYFAGAEEEAGLREIEQELQKHERELEALKRGQRG